MKENIYLPHLATIQSVEPETPDISTFRIVLDSKEAAKHLVYQPGQFAEISVFGVGEAPISIASSSARNGMLEFSIKKTGQVTSALHEMEAGSKIGIRGPFGNAFPVEELRGQNLLIIGGGIGLAPLRPLIYSVLDNRATYGKVSLVYGARSPQDIVYKKEIKAWNDGENIRVYLTVDQGDEEWTGNIGVVTDYLKKISPSSDNTTAITCGPPIMIKLVCQVLGELGFSSEKIITTLERKMRCGMGLCGHCNIGSKYVCIDGPVFTIRQLEESSPEW